MNASELNEYLSGEESESGFKDIKPRIELNDGESLSVQTGRTHYCTPRSNQGPWADVEVGFPSVEPPESWAQYFDGDWQSGDRTASVYGYVPIGLVVDFIEAHGGVKPEPWVQISKAVRG